MDCGEYILIHKNPGYEDMIVESEVTVKFGANITVDQLYEQFEVFALACGFQEQTIKRHLKEINE